MGCGASTANHQPNCHEEDKTAAKAQISTAAATPAGPEATEISLPKNMLADQACEQQKPSVSDSVHALKVFANPSNIRESGSSGVLEEVAAGTNASQDMVPIQTADKMAGSDVADLPPENAIDPSGFGEETSTAGLTVYSADTNLFTGGQAEGEHELVQELGSQKAGAADAEPARYTEEVAAFQAEQSLTGEASEASPWTFLQKTYSNVEDSAQSTSGQHVIPKCSTTLHQEMIIHDGRAADAQGSDLVAGQQPASAAKTSWQADLPSRPAPESAWMDASPGLTPSLQPHAGLHPTSAKLPFAAADLVPAQADCNELGMEDVDEFEAELAALDQAKAR